MIYYSFDYTTYSCINRNFFVILRSHPQERSYVWPTASLLGETFTSDLSSVRVFRILTLPCRDSKLHTKNAAFVVGLLFAGTHSFKIDGKITTLFQHTQIILKIWSVYLKNSKSFLKQMVTDEQKMLKLRIRHLLDTMKTSIRTLADTESERVMLGRQINGEDTIVSYQTIHKLLDMFPAVDANWLVMGEGGMYKSEHIAPHVFTQHNEVHDNRAGGDITVGSGTKVVPSTQKFEELQARVAELEHDKRTLQAVVDAMTSGARRK